MRLENRRNNTGNGRLIPAFPVLFRYFYPEGQQSLKDPVMCRYRSLRGFLQSNGEWSRNDTGMSGTF